MHTCEPDMVAGGVKLVNIGKLGHLECYFDSARLAVCHNDIH